VLGKSTPRRKHWFDKRDAGRVEVYLGRLTSNRTLDDETRNPRIRFAVRLLIHAQHFPLLDA